MKRLQIITGLAVLASLASCNSAHPEPEYPSISEMDITLPGVARMLSSLPLSADNLKEVYDAVNSSTSNGYDEEYMMSDLLISPGAGVGDNENTKASRRSSYQRPLKSLIAEYYKSHSRTKAGAADAEAALKALAESDLQIYWPYSADWDGETFPIVTFDPGYGAESNYGYEVRYENGGFKVVDSVYVDENVAMSRPVWVINTNDDSAYTPLELYRTESGTAQRTKGASQQLILKSFKMLRNYDSWFGGASEFFVKCGSVEGFTARTEAEMKLYNPSVTDFMVVVQRKYRGQDLDIGTIMVSSFTNQLQSLAFLVTEDDGGTRTSWKCSATVKVASKSYGIDIDLPFNEKDDIVWRGQLSADFFRTSDEVRGRFGDVEIVFSLM